MTPRVSVLMPVYNQVRYVRQSIESVLSQTFTDFELIVADDGSTDGTRELLRSVRDPRLVSLELPHGGCVPALAAAAARAQGDYLCRQDADDLSLPERLGQQVGFLDRNPGYALVGGDVVVMDPDGKDLCHLRMVLEDERIRKVFLTGLPFCGPMVMVRRKAAEAAGGFVDPRLTAFEDPDLCYRVTLRFPVANLPVLLYRYRRHPANVSVNDWHRREVERCWAGIRERHAARGSFEIPPVAAVGPVQSSLEDPFIREREALFWIRQFELGYLYLTHGMGDRGLAQMSEAVRHGSLSFGKRVFLRMAAVAPSPAIFLRRRVNQWRGRQAF